MKHDKTGPYLPYKLGAYFLKYCILVSVCYNFILEPVMWWPSKLFFLPRIRSFWLLGKKEEKLDK